MNTENKLLELEEKERKEIESLLNPKKEWKDEEFDNFLEKVTEISEIIKDLSLCEGDELEKALKKADSFIGECENKDKDKNKEDLDLEEEEIDGEIFKCKTKSDKTVINKVAENLENKDKNKDYCQNAQNQNQMAPDAWMRMVEEDAKEREENRKKRKEKSEEFLKNGNLFFAKNDYSGALSYYNKAIMLIKNSAILYNNRALTYIRLEIYSKAIKDTQNCLDLTRDDNLKAHLLKAKAIFLSGEPGKARECLENAKKLKPNDLKIIEDYEQKIFNSH